MHELHRDLLFLPERKKNKKVKKFVTNLLDKTDYVIHMRNLKQALDHILSLKKLHRAIKFNGKSWLKPYIDMNSKLRQKKKTKEKKEKKIEKSFLKLMQFLENAVSTKTMENVRKYRIIQLAATKWRRNYLASQPNYKTAKFFTENVLAIEMIKTRISMNNFVY